jgi:hypothetical protein
MAQDLLLTGRVTIEAFSSLIRAWNAPAGTFTMLEAQPERRVRPEERQDLLRFELFSDDLDLMQYNTGRLFHKDGEIRWERITPATVQVVYTGDEAYWPELAESEQRALRDEDYERVVRHYFLFGKRLDDTQLQRIGPVAQKGDFAEVRIPRLLRYPRLDALANAERARLALYEYHDRATGSIIAYRFFDLMPFRKREENIPA